MVDINRLIQDMIVGPSFAKTGGGEAAPGRQIKGSGGGLADAVPAVINGANGEQQPAALSEDEFVMFLC
jgi:hypothetical protein